MPAATAPFDALATEPWSALCTLERAVEESTSNSVVAATAAPGGKPARVCPEFHEAVELVGKRWTGAILSALIERPHYYAELTASISGLSDKLLSQRLRELEEEGIVERSVHPGSPARVSYALTDKGRDLRPAIEELRDWARRWK